LGNTSAIGFKCKSPKALTWEGRVSFSLTEALQLKKITYLEVVFDADLLEALGGEMALA
jgi:DNA recombination-dependent growth factor C